MDSRVLIVEDNLDDERLLMRQLRKANLDKYVKVINDGKIAQKYFASLSSESHQLVAVFLDLNLPSLSGIAVLECFRSQAHFKNVPVIVMKSSNSPTDIARCDAIGVSGYLQKPITLAAFTNAIANNFHGAAK